MNLFICLIGFVTVITCLPNARNKTEKPKRTLLGIQNPGEVKPVGIIYQVENQNTHPNYRTDEPAYNHANLQNFYTNTNKFFTQASTPVKSVKVFEEETPKVAAQHVLYEYEQTPTNAVSNVQVKQLFQPITGTNSEEIGASTPQKVSVPARNQFLSPAETVVNPVQHSSLVNHAQNFAQVNYHPLYNVQPTHTQHHQYIPNKYLYLNGKIVYQPGQHPPASQVQTGLPVAPRTSFQNFQVHSPQHVHRPLGNQNFLHQPISTAYQQNKQGQSLPLINTGNRAPLQKLSPPPVPFTKFHPPSQMEQITQPVAPAPQSVPEVEEQNQEEEEEKENVRDDDEANQESNEEEEEEDGEKANLEESEEEAEEDDDRRYRPDKFHSLFDKYSFEDDDDDHENVKHEDEEAEEDDRDSNRGSSKHVHSKIKKPNKKVGKNKGKYDKKDSYSFSEGYSTSSKYESPGKSKKNKNKPKRHYKKVKYSTNSNGKPKYEVIEGKHSEQIPITHKQKFLKEKFYLTRSFNDS